MYTAIVKPSTYNGKGAKEDANGYMPILLAPQFGTLPYEHIINGTIAKNLGLTTDACYLISATLEDRVNPADGLIRKQLQVTNLGVISAIELAKGRRDFIDAMGLGKVEPKAEVSNGYPKPEVAETEVEEEVPADGDKPF
jgi:hypothetical protein